MAQDGRRAQRSNDRVRTLQDSLKGAGARSADAPKKKEGCGCGCNGKRDTGAASLAEFAHQPGAPTPQLTLSSGNGKALAARSKRGGAVQSSKPAGRLQSLARRAAMSSRGKGAASGAQSAASLARLAAPG